MAIADWADCFPSTITIEPFVSRGDYTEPVYSSPQSYSGRVIYRNRLVRAADGQQVASRGEVWLQTTDVISVEDKVTLPDSTNPILLDVQRIQDEDGDHHVKLVFR